MSSACGHVISIPYTFDGLALLAELSTWKKIADKITTIRFRVDPPNVFGLSVCDKPAYWTEREEWAEKTLDECAELLFKECEEYQQKLSELESMMAADDDIRMLTVALGNLRNLTAIDNENVMSYEGMVYDKFQHVPYQEIIATGDADFNHFERVPTPYRILGRPLEKAQTTAMSRLTWSLGKAIHASEAKPTTLKWAKADLWADTAGAAALWSVQPLASAATLTTLVLHLSSESVSSAPDDWNIAQSGDNLASALCSMPLLETLVLQGSLTGAFHTNTLGPILRKLKASHLRHLVLHALPIEKAADMVHFVLTHKETLESVGLIQLCLITDKYLGGLRWKEIFNTLRQVRNLHEIDFKQLFELDEAGWYMIQFYADIRKVVNVAPSSVGGDNRYAVGSDSFNVERSNLPTGSSLSAALESMNDNSRLVRFEYTDLVGGDDPLWARIRGGLFPTAIRETAEQHFG
ncbi:uncharacterized protein K452DRAFT_311982 [Aplosporella prunicola CBS 121167]|uniref:Uncharacterized protein n=1 Tax=Aplosporella prunicola CBS 121167 TaxID=1176127 RepID=A0A6A6B392_9PEZI|nr:uncharacterized protein K452DRAFT_311982 [Aplosporella prunicola CBS 121167]KAF2137843.1 hypothetical protein K452DRAFT_311982 [Aplosporella prunicola CBS 121167]